MTKIVEYIERETVKQKLAPAINNPDAVDFWEWQCSEIDSIPAAAVRHVVTCGKCKYGKYTGTEWFCDKHSGHADKLGEDASYHEYHSKYWFCADGEKKNE